MTVFIDLMKPRTGTPRGRKSSIYQSDGTINVSSIRIETSEKEAKKTPVSVDKIIKYVNHFLKHIGITPCENHLFKLSGTQWIDYRDIQKKHNLNDKRDIVWMKFTQDGYLGVVAVSSDINFNKPDNHNRCNTSGMIIYHLGKQWDEGFVLLFPLTNLSTTLSRHAVECGIGNYLIENGVPILDFYSHNY